MVHAGAFLNCRLREARKVVVGDRRASREYETGGGCGGCKEQAGELWVMRGNAWVMRVIMRGNAWVMRGNAW